MLIVHLRRTLRMTEAAIAAKLDLTRSTMSRWLGRDGLGRLARIDPPEPARRYQRERPGELITLISRSWAGSTSPATALRAHGSAAATGAQAGTSCMSPSMTRHDWPTSRS